MEELIRDLLTYEKVEIINEYDGDIGAGEDGTNEIEGCKVFYITPINANGSHKVHFDGHIVFKTLDDTYPQVKTYNERTTSKEFEKHLDELIKEINFRENDID